MNQGQHILKMLEAVNADTSGETKDEINIRFWCWANGVEYQSHSKSGGQYIQYIDYLSSRNALKAARLEGWTFEHRSMPETDSYGCVQSDNVEYECWGFKYYLGCNNHPYVESKEHSTEEIAEFHAIVQTYIWRDENEPVKEGLDNDV